MDLSVAVLTADHKIGNADDFRKSVATALELAEETGGLVTIGIDPTRAETGYGYIEVLVEEPYYSQGHRVASFREKPDLATAMDMLAAGRFLWNSGMFFWKLRSFVGALERADAPVAEALTQISHALIAKDQAEAMRIFQTLPNLSIDYALMEKADNVWVVKASFPWDDVGEWSALERAREPDEDGNIFAGEVISLDTQGSIVLNEAEGVTTCVLGMNDVVVVATGDAILVCPKSKAQEVKRIVQELKARGSKKI